MTLMYVVLGNIKYKRVIALIKFFESRKNHEKRESYFFVITITKKNCKFWLIVKTSEGRFDFFRRMKFEKVYE